jgi:hypothetical protein
MLKQILESKISEKLNLNSYNNAGKAAIEWVDKFRNSFDIAEKIQQQFGNFEASNMTNSTIPHNTSTSSPNSTSSSTTSSTSSSTSSSSSSNTNQNNQIINSSSYSTASPGKSGSNLNYKNAINASTAIGASSNINGSINSINLTNNNNNNNNNNNSINLTSNNTVNHKQNKKNPPLQSQRQEKYHHSHHLTSSDNIDEYLGDHHLNAINNYNNSPPSSPNNLTNNSSISLSSILLSPKNSLKKCNNNNVSNQASQNVNASSEIKSSLSLSQNPDYMSSSSSISQKSSGEINQPTNIHHQHSNLQTQHSFGMSQSGLANEEREDTISTYSNPPNNSFSNAKVLVRQSTDLTSSFPLKPFQKINSETVEIPGLNVKVVRYRIENDLGRIEPHLYINYNSGGIDSNSGQSKAKLYFSLHYNEEIQSFAVTINKAEISNNYRNHHYNSHHHHHYHHHHHMNSNSPTSSSNFSMLNGSQANLSASVPSSPSLCKPDTYVKLQLLPDKKRKLQTRIQRKTLKPIFDETIYFQLPLEELQNKILYLALFEFERFSKHELIGAVRISDLHLIKDLTLTEIDFARNLISLAEVIFIK